MEIDGLIKAADVSDEHSSANRSFSCTIRHFYLQI